MKNEKPILFSGPMINAILEGRKTQTRRMVKYIPALGQPEDWCPKTSGVERDSFEHLVGDYSRFCPYGQTSDALWVRESWAEVGTLDPGIMVYRADYPDCVPAGLENIPPIDKIKWKPSIHMKRTACRIELEITGIRVERLQDISSADAKSEGIREPKSWETWSDQHNIQAYRELWESINGDGSWDANPWVWIVEFRRI